MTLAHAKLPNGSSLALVGQAPWPTSLLAKLKDTAFSLPADDPFVRSFDGPEHAYLDAAKQAWIDHPEHMDFLDPDSPIHTLKTLERDLYLHDWAAPLAQSKSILDIGCGVGRFTHWLLQQGKDVIGVDADLRSLQRLAWRAVGLPGRLDLHWSSVHKLPETRVDAVVAAEVLCYVPDADDALDALRARLQPGGVLCMSVEAKWGWALSVDATPSTIAHALLDEPVLDLPGEGWVRTYTAQALVAQLEAHGFSIVTLTPHHYVLDGPLERVAGDITDINVLLDLEAAARSHPIFGPLNRIWSVVAKLNK